MLDSSMYMIMGVDFETCGTVGQWVGWTFLGGSSLP
jgi:hypothetical protein